MTFSILASDPKTGQMGYAIVSGAPDAGSLAPSLVGGVGAVCAQGLPDVASGGRAMRLFDEGASAREVVDAAVLPDRERERRQFHALDAQGRTSAFTGKKCEAFAGDLSGEGVSVAGNMLKSRRVLADMLETFQSAAADGQDLSECLMRSIEAGQSAGGDRRGSLSCALEVQGQNGEVIAYLAIPSASDPVGEMRRQLSKPGAPEPRQANFTNEGGYAALPQIEG